MKAIMIIYNQAHTEKVEYLLEKLGIKGYLSGKMCRGEVQVPEFLTSEHMHGLK